MTRADVVAEAYAHMGTPYVTQAALKGVGVDCIGLCKSVGIRVHAQGWERWDADPRNAYGPIPDRAALIGACQDYLDPIPIPDAGLGDLLVMRFLLDPQHFAIVSRLDPMYVIHAMNRPPFKVAEHRIDEKWRKRIVAAFRYRGVE